MTFLTLTDDQWKLIKLFLNKTDETAYENVKYSVKMCLSNG